MSRVILVSIWVIAAVVLTTLALDKDKCYGLSRSKRFILGFTDNTNQRSSTRKLILLVVAFSSQQTEVTISSKFKINGHPYRESFMVEAGGFKRTTVPVELMMDGTERSLKAIDISASSEISAYGLMYQDFSTDGFLGIPTNNLGNQYVVVTPAQGPVWDRNLPAHFAVIGTEDSTTVRVSLRGSATFEGTTYSAGDVMTFTLNQLEAVQIQGQDRTEDFTGSIIQSDKPVSVFSGKECVNHEMSACDAMTQQLVPVKSWGQRHIYTAARSTDCNMYRIVAFTRTTVAISGFPDRDLEPGEFWEGNLTGSGMVLSNKPTLMMQHLVTINGKVVDPSFVQVPAEENFGYLFGFTTPPHPRGDSSGYFNLISIVVRTIYRQTVHLNGQSIKGADVEERIVPGTEYTSLIVKLPKGEGVYFVEQTAPRASPLSVIVYGYESDESYGYAAGLSLLGNEQLLSSLPQYLRELGGEAITITIPCLELTSTSLYNKNAVCNFTTGFGFSIVSADRIGFYAVICVTPTFYKVGLTSVYLSLDNGLTFPYSGVVYIASEEDLPPLLDVEQMKSEDRGGVIDLTLQDPIILTWNPPSFVDDILYLDLVVQDADLNADRNPVLTEGVTIKSSLLNNGTLTIRPEDVTTEGDRISLSVFYLRPNGPDRVPRRFYSGIRHITRYPVIRPCIIFNGRLMNTPSGVGPCPCTSDQARADALNFSPSTKFNFFHPGAQNCYRSTISSASGSGQQCCYGRDGNILVGPPGGGTADTFSPGDNFWRHQWYDVLPALGCCKLSDNCGTYYRFRPSDDCSEYNPPRPAGGTGDPHITSLDGSTFTFNGAGEFLMAHSPLHNLTFQAQMEKYRDTQASVFTAFAIKANDSSTVQVQISSQNETSILVDGGPLRLDSHIQIHHLKGVRINLGSDQTEIRITFAAGFGLVVIINPKMMSFIAQLDIKFQGRVGGLLGNFNGDADDDLQFPNGAVLKPHATLGQIHDFGLAWLIVPEDSVFSYTPPYDYNFYYLPEFSPVLDIPDLDFVSLEVKELCDDSVECVFDAVTTGSLVFAYETLLVTGTITTFQEAAVKIVSCGFPGSVEDGTVTGSVYLVNSAVGVVCDSGFTLDGSPKLICQADGQWSFDLPRCTRCVRHVDDSLVKLGVGSVIGIVLGAASIGFIIGCGFCCCFLCHVSKTRPEKDHYLDGMDINY